MFATTNQEEVCKEDVTASIFGLSLLIVYFILSDLYSKVLSCIQSAQFEACPIIPFTLTGQFVGNQVDPCITKS
jgi:hypothetical protein